MLKDQVFFEAFVGLLPGAKGLKGLSLGSRAPAEFTVARSWIQDLHCA